jgi:chlorobactene glucosyltransferase
MLLVLGLFIFFISVALEALLFYESKLWKKHRHYVVSIAGFLGLSLAILTPILPLIIGFALWITSIYRFVNHGRIYISRLPSKHLHSIAMQTFAVTSAMQALTLILYVIFLFSGIQFSPDDLLGVLLLSSACTGLVILISTVANLFSSKPIANNHLTDNELPTVTIAIPARNETPKLTSCLESIVASDYPKLEILVLDDNSQDKTAEVIKSFALQGVRFIKGDVLRGTWLAKNKAYETLFQQASGDIVFYMGVDVRLHPNSVRRLVEQFLTRNANMMTILPKRTKSGFVAAFIQPMRYWWEIAVPQFMLRRPPALSTSWMVSRQSLIDIDGFKTYKRSIVPEEHLARYFCSTKSYVFIRTTKDMLVTTHKDFSRQWDTQVRTRYPHAHRRPENVLLQSLALLLLIITPFIALPILLFGLDLYWIYNLALFVAICSLLLSHLAISIITNPAAGFLAPLNFPIAVLLDIIALHVSMYKYEFSYVKWKGRDIAPKKLEVIPHLPDLEITLGSEKTH